MKTQYYRENETGDFLAIDPSSNAYYKDYLQQDNYEGRATAIANNVNSVCTTSVSRGFLDANCTRVKRSEIPAEWLSKLNPTTERKNTMNTENLEGYKENLLQNVRYTASKLGGKVRVKRKYNERTVRIEAKDGRFCEVWFPIGPRVKNLEIQDLKDGCEWIFGVKPFAIKTPITERKNTTK